MSNANETQESKTIPSAGGGSFLTSLAGFLLFPVLAFGLILVAAGLGLIYFENHQRGRIYPGVVVWGVDLSQMTTQEARDALIDVFPYPHQNAFSFHDAGADQRWIATPAQLGLRFDADATVNAALQLGRDGHLINNLIAQADLYLNGRHLSPVVVYDSNEAIAFLESIALEVYQPMVDAGLVLAEDKLVATPSQVGRQANIADAYRQLAAPLGSLEGAEIELLIDETEPEITDEAVAAVIDEAERLIGLPLTVFLSEPAYDDDPEPLTLGREELVGMLILELDESVTPPSYHLHLDAAALTAWLEPLAPLLDTESLNARFVFNDDTQELEILQSSVPARKLNIDATVEQILARATSDDREVPLVIEWIKPAISEDATAEELGISELIAQGQTLFTGSSAVRVHNVAVAASRFHGIVIPPGETFSFNEYLGDVSLETGFEEGLIIFGGRTIKGVGGGVCQVSTTAFQAAFYAGYPILARVPHGYRVGYYEHGEGAGMDATVFSPEVDFQFVNDLPHHLLIETYTNESAQRLTFKFYSTSDGRTVEKIGPEITDVVPHPPDLYEEDPDLEPGEIKQVDWAADGANVLVQRIVRSADGEVILEEDFVSHYLPWQAVFHYGPGTEGMPPEPTPEPEATPTP